MEQFFLENLQLWHIQFWHLQLLEQIFLGTSAPALGVLALALDTSVLALGISAPALSIAALAKVSSVAILARVLLCFRLTIL